MYLWLKSRLKHDGIEIDLNNAVEVLIRAEYSRSLVKTRV
jgi:hypothetical protein